MIDRLDALSRPDKWYLGAGEGVIWAPPFARYMDRPGFWDEGHVFHFPVRPLFTVVLVDARGREEELRPLDRHWRPDRLTVRWQVGEMGPVLVEERSVLPGARFASIWRPEDDDWDQRSLDGAWLAAFTQIPADEVLPGSGSGSEVAALPAGVTWRRRVTHREHLTTVLGFRLLAGSSGAAGAGGAAGAEAGVQAGGSAPVRRWAIRSEGRETPDWMLTPFPEMWPDPRDIRPGPDGTDAEGTLALPGGPGGWIHAAVVAPLGGRGFGEAVSFTLAVETPGYLAPASAASAPSQADAPIQADAPSQAGAQVREAGIVAAGPASPGEGTDGWRAALEAYPRFRCSDPWLDNYWDYRIYGLHLNRLSSGPAGYPHPAIAEGIDYFHWPISYSAQCHMMETRWGDAAAARGSLLNFLAAQQENGRLPGRLNLCPDAPAEPDFYHANWGDAVLAVDALHPDEAFLAEAYGGLARYARWLMDARDPDGTGMVTVTNHYETGQEYMSRYTVVNAEADTTEWEPRLSLKGIDVTVYHHRLQRALTEMARRLGRQTDVEEWVVASEASGRAILDRMWDPETGIFSDVDGGTMGRTGIKAAVCFYPLLTDLLDDEHVARLLAHLEDPGEFWTPWPVPSSSVDDPLYDPDALWKGKRHNCPWNGRVWPMTNSHVVEGLLRQWRAGRRSVGPMAAELLRRSVGMMFDDQDPNRPNCFEHYNPETGHPSRYRGIDDYQHSWVLDLLARGAAGLDPDGWLMPGASRSTLVVDPLPLQLESLDLEGARIRGHGVDVRIRGEELTVTVDGEAHRGRVGEPLSVPLSEETS